MTAKFLVGSFFCIALALPSILRAGDSKADKSDSKAAATDSAAPAGAADSSVDSKSDGAKVKGRLPSGWGKLGVTDAQKQSIYKIEANYDGQIDAVKKQLSDLEAKRLADMRNVLTDAQQKRLDDKPDSKSAKKTAVADSKATDSKDDSSAAPAMATTKASKKSSKHGDSTSDSASQVAGTTGK